MNTQLGIRSESSTLNCRIQFIQEETESFSAAIRGMICAADNCSSAVANITIIDITDGEDQARPVRSLIEKKQIDNSPSFCHTVNLGKLPSQVTTLADWMTIAKIPLDWLMLPHTGIRNLRFDISIQSGQNGKELACSSYELNYENLVPGYIELEENINRALTIAVPLAFVVAATDRKISARAIELIYRWMENNSAISKDPNFFDILLAHIIAFLPGCSRLYCYAVCKKITSIVPVRICCNILELCLRVAGADGIIADTQLVLLKHIGKRLGIHRERFRSMLENILPLRMSEIEDLEISLGIAPDMDSTQICHQLSKEYRKWNARVTNRNPEVQNQAEKMLNLIAEMRNQHAE